MTTFDDDQEIIIPSNSAPRPAPIVPGRVQMTITNNNTAPLEENTQTMLLELTGGDRISDRPGLDLVAVLDVSGSMRGDKIEKMKIAMFFVLKKLSAIDRLSIVTFSTEAKRPSELRQMTPDSQMKLENIVKDLEARGYTNTYAGLEVGLKILKDRKFSKGRACGILLMSDGDQTIEYGDAAMVPIDNVAVHTFGFGEGMDPKVLKDIAENSMGGTFSDVRNMDNLSQAFSLCLGGLLTVVAQELTLTIKQMKSTLKNVSVRGYPLSNDSAPGTETILFGDLYSKEVRNVLVDVLLPAVAKPRGVDILNVTYTYKFAGELYEATPAYVNVRRISLPAGQQQAPPKVIKEEARQKNAEMVNEAIQLADDRKIDKAQVKIDDAQSMLEDTLKQKLNSKDALIESLIGELQELKKLMQSQDIYDELGRAFAYALLSSHDKQRPSAKGDDIAKFLLYATPVAVKIFEQAKNFDDNPSVPPPSVDDDVKEAVAADPLAEVSGLLTEQLDIAIKALQSIANIIKKD